MESIAIIRDNVRYELDVYKSVKPKYNYMIGEIGKPEVRRISHSNTIALPMTANNIKALNLTQFNNEQLATSLNTKYPYERISDSNVQTTGRLVVNNIEGRNININLTEEAVDLLAKWGAYTIEEALNDAALVANASIDYQTAIAAIKSYDMPATDTAFSVVSDVPNHRFPLALFPNTMNPIGDKFNTGEEGRNPIGYLNMYQTRPLWNFRGILDYCAQAFGYTVNYRSSADVFALERSYIAPEQSKRPDIPTKELIQDSAITTYDNDAIDETMAQEFIPNISGVDTTTKGDITNWSDPQQSLAVTRSNGNPWLSTNPVYLPTLTDDEYYGKLKITGFIEQLSGVAYSNIVIVSGWRHIVSGDITWKPEIPIESEGIRVFGDLEDEATITSFPTNTDFSVTIDKRGLNTPAVLSTGEFLGLAIMVQVQEYPVGASPSQSSALSTLSITEETPPEYWNEISEDGNYDPDRTTNLCHDAPRKSIKEVVSSILRQTGLLIAFNDRDKEINIFSYEEFQININKGSYYDWTNYLVDKSSGKADTNFGSNYALTNDISLESPYKGNINTFPMPAQPAESKYQPYVEAKVSGVKDIEGAINVATKGGFYLEVTHKGFGAVYSDRLIADIKQRRSGLSGYEEAEDLDLSEATVASSRDGYSGGGYVSYDNESTAYIGFELESDVDTDIVLKIRYSPTSSLAYDMKVEDEAFGFIETASFQGSTIVEWKVRIWTISIKKGLNRLRLMPDGGVSGIPLIDYIAYYPPESSAINVPYVLNMNYNILPKGVEDWYDTVGKAVRYQKNFLLPYPMMKDFDITKPVYVEELGGFFSIEKISEYVDAQTKCEASLIKVVETTGQPVEVYYDTEDVLSFGMSVRHDSSRNIWYLNGTYTGLPNTFTPLGSLSNCPSPGDSLETAEPGEDGRAYINVNDDVNAYTLVTNTFYDMIPFYEA